MTPRRRRSTGPGAATYVVLGGVLLLGAAGWWWLRSRDVEVSEPLAPVVAQGEATDEAPPPSVPPLDLPELSMSDALVRTMVAALSEHPQVARWLVTDDLVRRFVGAVVDVAGGVSPREHVEFLVPGEAFTAQSSGETLLLGEESHARYDLLGAVVSSLDTEGTAVLYHQLHPLFVDAYDELGIPEGSFDDAMALALGNVLSVRVPPGPVQLRQNEAVYEFVDPELESRSSVEKHMIRMGSDNATQIQSKVQEIRDAIAALQRSGGM